jgi:hypothetical protein
MYSNENIPLPVVQHLRRLQHDVLTVFEAGNANTSISDAEVLAFAVQQERIVLTINRKDFIALHNNYKRAKKTHYGVIVCTKDDDFKRFAMNVHTAIESELPILNKLVRVYKGN